jgi:hypothetical protein
MAARAQARWLEELKVMVRKRGDPTVIVLILERSVRACLKKQREDA